jgi:RNA polymerase sigma-70 factor (ECF subfamily)
VGQREQRFRHLYVTCCPRVLAYTLRRSDSQEDAADAVAEIFAVAWRRFEQVPDGEAAILWLYATGRHVLANQRRRSRSRAEVVRQLGQELGANVETEPDGLFAADVLRMLSEEDREILMLSGWEGLNANELAQTLGCSPNAARIRLHRARTRLRTHWQGRVSAPSTEVSSARGRSVPGSIEEVSGC